MTRDESLSRREVLASVGSIGAFGLGGVGTLAHLSDRERGTTRLGTGRVALTVDCDGCSAGPTAVSVPFDRLDPGEERVESLRLGPASDSNAVRLWGRLGCPTPTAPLGGVLEARLVVERDGDRRYPLGTIWRTLNELRTRSRDGVRLDDPEHPCLAAGETLTLRFEYRLPPEATWAVEAETTVTLELFAQQCRHVAEGGVTDSPFADEPCPTLDCPDCVRLGKLEVTGDRLRPDTVYEFDELDPQFDDGHTYALEVLTVTDKVDDGERETVCASFRLLRDGTERAAPAICGVTIGAAGTSVAYGATPPSTRTRGELCATRETSAPGTEPDGARPAISNIVVSVCTDREGGGDDCVRCPRPDGERIVSATFRYEGPSGVAVVIEQFQSGNSPAETVRQENVDDGDTLSIPLNGRGRPDFDARVVSDDGTDALLGSFHTSCSEPFGPGTELTDGTYTLTVTEATDTVGNALCGGDDAAA